MLSERIARGGGLGRSSVPELNDYRNQNRSLDGIVEYHNMQFILLGRSEPERVETGVVSWNFFDLFGVKPLAGRMFGPDDERPGAPAVLLLSYEYWQRSFGGDLTVVGKTFRMNDKPHTVIGVLPPFPQYPDENDVYMPSVACPFRSDPALIANRQGRMLRLFGRMKPGVKPAQAEADLSTVAATMQREYPGRLFEGHQRADAGDAAENRAHPRRQAHHAVPAGCRGLRVAHRLRQRRQSQFSANGAPRTRNELAHRHGCGSRAVVPPVADGKLSARSRRRTTRLVPRNQRHAIARSLCRAVYSACSGSSCGCAGPALHSRDRRLRQRLDRHRAGTGAPRKSDRHSERRRRCKQRSVSRAARRVAR